MLRRIFIAINLPSTIKEELLALKKKWQELPARWASKDNLHITLAFLGSLSDQELASLQQTLQQLFSPPDQSIGLAWRPFALRISRIAYGPTNAMPRMIWAFIDFSEEFQVLRTNVERVLASSSQFRYIPEKRRYFSHITLARIRQWEFQKINPEERPEINEHISLSFSVESIELMESKLKRGGAEYAIIDIYP